MSKKNRTAGALTVQPPPGKRSPLSELNGKPHEPASAPAPSWEPTLSNILKPLASLRLTVVLMLLAMILVYAGTLAQVDKGIWQVVDKYFWSTFVFIPAKNLVPPFLIKAYVDLMDYFGVQVKIEFASWLGFPFIGGKLLALLLLANLLAAHIRRFTYTWKRLGIWVIHGGLVLLLVGEAVTRERAEEMRMPIEEGKSASYLMDSRHYELAFVDLSDAKVDRVAVVPANLLKEGARIVDPALPVDIEVVKFMVNSDVPDEPPAGFKNPATRGAGARFPLKEIPEVSGTDKEQRDDVPAVYVKLTDRKSGGDLGTWLFTPHLKDQRADFQGKPFEVSLRNRREYLPYTLHLTKFTHDVYEGTDKPKDFRSHVRLTDSERQTERDLEIYMNAPLRYRGKAFFQSGFMDPKQTGGVRGTILQVVDNPGWLIPYIACIVVSVGLFVHFGFNLVQFLRRNKTAPYLGIAALAFGHVWFSKRVTYGSEATPESAREEPAPANEGEVGNRSRRATYVAMGLAAAIVGVFVLYLGGLPHRRDRANNDGFDLEALRRLPVLSGGRVQPLDTVARSTLRLMSGGEEYEDANEKKQPAIKWFADVMFTDVRATSGEGKRTGPLWEAPAFKIDNDQVLNMLGLNARSGFRYSLREFYDHWERMQREFERARTAKQQDKYKERLEELANRITQYERVRRGFTALIPPPAPGDKWLSFHERKREYALADPSLVETAEEKAQKRVLERNKGVNFKELSKERRDELVREYEAEKEKAYDELFVELDARLATDPSTASWIALRQAYRDGDHERFNKLVSELSAAPNAVAPQALEKTKREMFFNTFAPFYQSMGMYVCAAALCLIGLLLFAVAPEWTRAARWPAFGLTLLAFAVHSAGLLARMYLQGRPPVTNLYSSAIFIGWGAVLLCLVVELIYSYGVANLVGAKIGFLTCLVAHYLSKTSGDTLEMMQAVLDTNFWLATHVTMVTFGYVATFFAGVLGAVFLALGTTTRVLDNKPFFKAMTNMLYGIICFATMLSFIGTVLGGIWADQSWGRFWGWDPKENGAILVVVWNALILHARWAGLVQQRGMAVLAVLGNIVTTWSWFGTNMLGVGLHTYGFSKELLMVILSVSSVSLLIAALGTFLHPRHWMSYGGRYDSRVPEPSPLNA